jgi:hypothetical protein
LEFENRADGGGDGGRRGWGGAKIYKRIKDIDKCSEDIS